MQERIPSTAARAYRIMHAILNTAVDDQLIALPRFVLDAIDTHLATFVGGDPDGPLFPGEAGGIISDGAGRR